MVDAQFTWWVQGKAYLCRIVDMLHMRYVDEVLFGHEVVGECREFARVWVKLGRSQGKQQRPTAELFRS